LCSSFSLVYKMHDRTRCHLNSLRLIVAIERFQGRNGGVPQSLDELVPSLLSELPQDPFAPDGRFRYLLLDPATDPHDRSYLLYSVGSNCEDDGGAMHSEDNSRSLDMFAREKSDFIINLPACD